MQNFMCDLTYVGAGLPFYRPTHWEAAGRFDTTKQYAEARTAMAMVCVDGVPCGYEEDGTPVVVLVLRKDKEESDGPFAGQYWIVGGKWNWVDTFSEFIRTKAIGELFNGNFNRDELYVPEGFIGGMPIMVGWSAGENSPYGLPGVSWQCCYQVIFKNRIRKEMFKLDENHEDYVFIRPGDHLAHLHPYVRDVIQMSGWLTQKHS
jgi:hypothetical protein